MSKKDRFNQVMQGLLQNLPIQFRGMALSLSRLYLQKMGEEQIEAFLDAVKRFTGYIEGVEEDESREN